MGYARVSTGRQGESLEAQRTALEVAGCDRVFVDEVSGAKAVRPGLAQALDFMREDDELVVVRLDRLGRSAADTMTTIQDLDAHGVRLRALDFDLDTASPSGRLVVGILVQLAQWERDLLIERTHEGLAHARAQGRVGGRPSKLTAEQVESVRVSREAGMSVQTLAEMHGVSRRTIARAVRERA
ncbi:recombinase family protein [Kocuria soli]|uniref:recombinase family protein n=1 Tax=Kocuria soli TaxID=2485125 RepID=UPI0022792A56|nr:recombinase family protein [Kocuria soli]